MTAAVRPLLDRRGPLRDAHRPRAFDGDSAVAIALKQVSEPAAAAAARSTPRSARRSTPSSCGRSPRTPRSASQTRRRLHRARSTPPRPTRGAGDTAERYAACRALRLERRIRARRKWWWIAGDRRSCWRSPQPCCPASSCHGRTRSRVPESTGSRSRRARRCALQRRRLRGRRSTRCRTDEPGERVIEQDPTRRARPTKGSTVSSRSASGPAPVKVPRCCRHEPSKADEAARAEAGFEVGQSRAPSRRCPRGHGDRDRPAAGTERRARRSTITLDRLRAARARSRCRAWSASIASTAKPQLAGCRLHRQRGPRGLRRARGPGDRARIRRGARGRARGRDGHDLRLQRRRARCVPDDSSARQQSYAERKLEGRGPRGDGRASGPSTTSPTTASCSTSRRPPARGSAR